MRMRLLLSKTIHLFIYSCMFLFFQSSIRSQPTDILSFCDSQGSYTNSSGYETNLKILLSSLTTTAPSSNGYYNSTFGVDPNRVYGTAQCRGEVPPDYCRKCLNTSMDEIIKRCPYKKQAAIRVDNCILRYSDQRFLSRREDGVVDFTSSEQNVSYPVRFNERLGGLLRKLASEAAMTSADKSASDSIPYSNISAIAGRVECIRYVSNVECDLCLQSMIGWIPTCCNGKESGKVSSVICTIEYYNYMIGAVRPSPLQPPLPPVEDPPVPPPLPRDEDSNSTNTTNRHGNGRNQSRVIIFVSVATVLGLALFGFIVYCYLRGRKRQDKEKGGSPVDLELMDSTMYGEQTQDLPLIDLVIIQAATNNFSDENKLGEGGFGPVYKGMLSDGKEIAVKRLARSSSQGLEEFKNEVTLIAKLQHRNLVRLLYCCIERGEKLLIYEYMPNTSLDVFIFDPIKRSQLGWERCHNIVGGIAKGLVYLHEDSRLRIIHRDLKASNVLLDHEMNPKISDFGMARFLGGNQNQINTNRVVGTYGYMAPEYAMGGLFSVKSDVYSFGVLLLEIVSGRRNNNHHLRKHAHSLLTYAWGLWCQGKALELIDPLLAESCLTSEVLKWIHIGLLCVQEDAADRPMMSSVIVMLGSESMTLPQPTQPGFFVARTVTDLNKASASAKICSNNELTISTLKPR